MAADRLNGRARVSQSYFRSPTFLQLTCDRYLGADRAKRDVAAPHEGEAQARSPVSPDAAAAVTAQHSAAGPADALYASDGGDDASAARRRYGWRSTRSTSLLSMASLRSSPTLLGFTSYRGGATPPSVAPSPPPSSATAAYGRRPLNRRAVSQSLVEAWDLAQRAGYGSSGGAAAAKALAERLRVAEQVQRAIDAAEGERQAAAAADRSPPPLPSPYRRLAGSSERGARLSVARYDLKYKNIFFNVGLSPSGSAYSSSDCLLAGGEVDDRLRNSSAGGGGGGVNAKKRVRFTDALSWEVLTPTA